MSNPIPAAAQGGIHGHRTQTATFHATITQPDIGTSDHGCIPLTELGAIGDRYNVTRNSHRVLTSLKEGIKASTVDDAALICAFLSASNHSDSNASFRTVMPSQI